MTCNPRWRRAGSLKANIGDKQTLFCLTLIPHRWAFYRHKAVFPTIKRLRALRVEVSFKSERIQKRILRLFINRRILVQNGFFRSFDAP